MSTYSSIILARSSLLAYFRLGESSGGVAFDISVNGENALIHSGVTLGAAGLLDADPDTAMSFNGVTSSGFINQTSGPDPSGRSAFSVECWFKATSTSGTTGIVSNGLPGSSNLGVALVIISGTLYFEVGNGSTNANVNTSIATGTIYHLVMTYDGSVVTAYLNGSSLGTHALTGTIGSTTDHLMIGCLNTGSNVQGDFFSGVIDEVSYYSSVLTQSDVTLSYLAGKSVNVGFRVRTSAQVQGGFPLRARIAARVLTSTPLRLFFSSGVVRDTLFRMILRIVMRRDAPFRLMTSAFSPQDVLLRYVLRLIYIRAMAFRLNLSAISLPMIVLRLLFGISKDLSVRVVYYDANSLDTAVRLLLTLLPQIDLAFRLTLLTGVAKGTTSRLVVKPSSAWDTLLRAAFQATLVLWVPVRCHLVGLPLRDTKVRLAITSSSGGSSVGSFAPRVFGGTIILAPVTQLMRSTLLRMILTMVSGIPRPTLALRLMLFPFPPVPPSIDRLPQMGYAGYGDVPIGAPVLPYMVNGIILDTQPYLYTVPMTIADFLIPVGSTFLLTFSNPTSTTLTALTNGRVVSMRFGLAGGASASGLVQVSSTLTENILQVLCRVVAPISLFHPKIRTQFT